MEANYFNRIAAEIDAGYYGDLADDEMTDDNSTIVEKSHTNKTSGDVATLPKKRKAAKGDPKDAKFLDPAKEAGKYIKGDSQDGLPRQRYYKGAFWRWSDGAYREQAASEARARLVQFLNKSYVNLTARITNDVLDQLKAQTILDGRTTPPSWLDGRADMPPREVLCCPNGLIHLPPFADGSREYRHEPTPRFFSTAALDFDFDADAPQPSEWLQFLSQLWPDDPQSIETLQEWSGYCLVADTSQQKMLALIGPKRAGKGVIARVERGLVGAANTAGPTLASFAQNFGLWPLLGKSLAIISDARLSGKSDSAVVVERLLSITGEDSLTVDKKYAEPVTGKLSTRLMMLSNELPRLADSSGALASRMILLRLDASFYGREDHRLTDKLLVELPGIMIWAIEGWRRLRERGHFVQPASGEEMLDVLADLSSAVGAFVQQECELGPECRCRIEDLYERWCDWCKTGGRRDAGNIQTFGRDLLAAVPGLRNVRPREDGDRYRGYDGIRLQLY